MLEAMALSDYVIYKYRDMSEFQSSCKTPRQAIVLLEGRRHHSYLVIILRMKSRKLNPPCRPDKPQIARRKQDWLVSGLKMIIIIERGWR